MPLAGSNEILVPEPQLSIRICTVFEVPHLREAAIRHHLQEWPKPEGKLDPETWGYLGDPPGRFDKNEIPVTLVATFDGEYVGQGSLIPQDMDHWLFNSLDAKKAGKLAWMGGLCVLPAFRRKGIGKKLHYERLRIAARLGISRLLLFTEKREYPTVELYKQFGWRVECEVPDFDDGSTTERRWVMRIVPRQLFSASLE